MYWPQAKTFGDSMSPSLKKYILRASLVVQWLRVCNAMQGDTSLIPGLGISHMSWSD